MNKTGKYRAFRNMPVGWLLQAIHSTDRSERLFRIVAEIIIFLVLYFVLVKVCMLSGNISFVIMLFICVHTFTFIANGNFLVYLLDSFSWFRNPGISEIIKFSKICRKYFCKYDSCDAILIYGSMCRKQFHIRSDLDLRVVRRTDSLLGLLALPIGYLIRIYSLLKLVPVDLQVVDSFDFINNQMRFDEKPIVVYCRSGIKITNHGMYISEVEYAPECVLKR